MNVRHLFLTPIPEALPYITDRQSVIGAVIGANDPFMGWRTLKAHCDGRCIPCAVIDGVAHSLEDDAHPVRNAQVLETVADMCK